MRRSVKVALSVAAVVAAVGGMVRPASAVLIQPTDTGVPSGSRPNDAVIARVSNNASGVVIGPNDVLSVRHSGIGVGGTVEINSVIYDIIQATPIGAADLQVFKIAQQVTGLPANLSNIAPLYTSTDEVGKTFVIGGYGQGTGAPRITGVTTTGYNWDGSANTTLRFGDNKFDASYTTYTSGPYTSAALGATFDQLGTGNATAHEAAPTLYDSGSGLFILSGGQWKVAALGGYVAHVGYTDFGDTFEGPRVSTYASQINSTVPEPSTAALGAIAGLLMLARRRRCSGI